MLRKYFTIMGAGYLFVYMQSLYKDNKILRRDNLALVRTIDGHRKMTLFALDILDRHDIELDDFEAIALEQIGRELQENAGKT